MKLHKKTTQFLPQTGVTLVEMVVVIVILAIALTAVTQTIGQNTISGAYTYDETKAIELAQSYLNEIKSKRFDENSPIGGVPPCDGVSGVSACTVNLDTELGPDSGESSRSLYDDLDDYDDLDEGSGSGNALLDAEGNTRSGYENFRVQVQVTYSGDVAPRSGGLTDAKKIVVTVTQPNADTLQFTAHRGNY
jgi:MSHA pilin protein MshD